MWSLPGGVLELGESLVSGVAREVREETGLDVTVGPLLEIFEHIARDDEGRIQYHYVIADYMCRAGTGLPHAGSDAAEIALADPEDLNRFALTDKAVEVIKKAISRLEPT